jgi:hypothetical protein
MDANCSPGFEMVVISELVRTSKNLRSFGPVTMQLNKSGLKYEKVNVKTDDGLSCTEGSAPKVGGYGELGRHGSPLIE